MRKITIRSIIFIAYTLILAILVTAYMGENTYLLNFYILPILFGAYYFDVMGGAVFILISAGLSLFFMYNSGKASREMPIATPITIQIIIYTVVGIIVGIFQRENNKLNNYLLKASLTDQMTDLYNYGYFAKRIEEEIARAERYKHSVALIMLDIDYFKKYNDTYGHQKGNQVLEIIAKILTENKRESDIAFRYGGEEFCVILPETGDDAKELADRFRQKVEEAEFPNNVKVTISAGVSSHPYKNKEIGLVERTDRALYEAKETGRNKVCVFRG